MLDDSCWPPPAMLRFAGSQQACPPVVDIDQVPIGYDQSITGFGIVSPLPITQMQLSAAFTRDAGLPAGTLPVHGQYLPTSSPSGIVGGGLFGPGAIGHRVAYHGMLLPQIVAGFTVYEPAPGGDPRK